MKRNKYYIHFLGLLLFILLSCKKENNESAIKGRINEIIIDFVKLKRDWCRFSKITFKAEILNKSKDTLHLNDYGEIDFCDLTESKCGYITGIDNSKRPEIWNISNANQTVHVTLLKKPKLILPFQCADLEFSISEKIMGLSLKEINKNYEWILKSDFKIICDSLFSNNHHQITFIKKDNISKIEFIDDIPR
ncbi:hypothetical protein [Flavobacterium sp. NRK F7]|uniref:hypothetical protein n=1 Tax=Flavobacterium sp. NRK F7 TaxID=2954930 RepID=UPI0020910FC9|nr:hypothetical protein [Flavobacterium sp. NRK F7]MCO6162097.1 hypothetical protein [Flavobacterium sp. NRK F7]